jgi:hypothetical protein
LKSLEKYIYNLSGFTLPEYSICFTGFTSKNIPGIITENFIIDSDIFENNFSFYLSNWLNITHKVLWQTDAENSFIYVFENSLKIISDEWTYLLNLSKNEIFKGLGYTVCSLAEAHFFIEKFVYNIEGNWLLKKRNEEPADLIRCFIFWAASRSIKNDYLASRCFDLFLKRCAHDVFLEEYKIYSDEEMINAFMQCFYRNINDRKAFQQFLDKELVF